MKICLYMMRPCRIQDSTHLSRCRLLKSVKVHDFGKDKNSNNKAEHSSELPDPHKHVQLLELSVHVAHYLSDVTEDGRLVEHIGSCAHNRLDDNHDLPGRLVAEYLDPVR